MEAIIKELDKYLLVSKEKQYESIKRWKLKNPEIVKAHNLKGMLKYLNNLTDEEKKAYYKKLWSRRKQKMEEDPEYKQMMKEKSRISNQKIKERMEQDPEYKQKMNEKRNIYAKKQYAKNKSIKESNKVNNESNDVITKEEVKD